ncbi:hypothetical protein LPTSP3_g34450 [Leptospira kobayashii]|uniref:FecR protein domain-containing protein n=2 Tax=Leptospira kobayashii TaxID=1917830 RepID=A0ABM7UN27_9LEPT|nr:hypothetical protein LPTSP3_g34450 [Leptospira kobayashii]
MVMRHLTIQTLLLLTFTFSIHAGEFAVAGYVKGKVSVLSADDTAKLWKTFKVNDVLKPGDTIQTGNGSKVDLVFKETEFRIQPNSSFTLKEWNPKQQISKGYLEKGAAWFKVKDFKKGFEVVSPTTTAGVRGTAFGVYYEEKDKKTLTCVCEGKVDVNGKVFSQGTSGTVTLGSDQIESNDYKDLIAKSEKKGFPGGATVQFEKKLKESPLLTSCLSCHKPTGWEAKGIIPDQKYSN